VAVWPTDANALRHSRRAGRPRAGLTGTWGGAARARRWRHPPTAIEQRNQREPPSGPQRNPAQRSSRAQRRTRTGQASPSQCWCHSGAGSGRPRASSLERARARPGLLILRYSHYYLYYRYKLEYKGGRIQGRAHPIVPQRTAARRSAAPALCLGRRDGKNFLERRQWVRARQHASWPCRPPPPMNAARARHDAARQVANCTNWTLRQRSTRCMSCTCSCT
jgi:hypothetical protein